jgi:elongator complex protein 3
MALGVSPRRPEPAGPPSTPALLDRGPMGAGVRRKPTRTLSGVAIVAVMTAPAACPHGRCTYCPGGLPRRSPQSYTGEEPSAMRAAQYGYDPRRITTERLASLEAIGHPTSKVEVIVQGGTFPSRPIPYQNGVFQGIFEGLNRARSDSLAEAQVANESADRRCVGLTVETRPDWCDGRILPHLLDAGVTRVEIGVECLHDDVLRAVGRAHGSNDVALATREARTRGLKVCYHLMLGLPGMDAERDLADLRALWTNADYRPDMIKIYPTLVIADTPLYEDWLAGKYQPYDTETAVRVLAAAKREIPPWVRIQRVQRDIPARLIVAGVRHGNVRQLAQAHLAEEGHPCRCLRCREFGRRARPPPERFELIERRYEAAGGREVFLSFEDPETETIAGFLRLRIPVEPKDGALTAPVIRELKSLGVELAVGSAEAPGSMQHRGLGRRLVREATERSAAAGFDELFVLSAVGTRGYYRKLGFERAGSHMRASLRAGAPPLAAA